MLFVAPDWYPQIMEKVAEGLFRLGSRWVNFYLIEADDAVTIVDAVAEARRRG